MGKLKRIDFKLPQKKVSKMGRVIEDCITNSEKNKLISQIQCIPLLIQFLSWLLFNFDVMTLTNTVFLKRISDFWLSRDSRLYTCLFPDLQSRMRNTQARHF